jgi:hypothetical protein
MLAEIAVDCTTLSPKDPDLTAEERNLRLRKQQCMMPLILHLFAEK